MLTKNLTPFLTAALPCSTRRGRLEMTVVVRATYAIDDGGALTLVEGLDQGFLSGEVAADEEDPLSEVVYPGDFAAIKLNAEIMVRGTCHVPGDRPVLSCPARVSVGPWSKTLLVTGPRTTTGVFGGASELEPFRSMPIRWSNAFGGPGVPQNPVGVGSSGPALPTILASGQAPEEVKSSRFGPAGFAPINANWAPRAGRRGTQYGKSWRERRAPYLAEDADPSITQCAPADQQLRGYLRGDETVSFQNLHPASAVLSVELPRTQVRAFANDAEGRFQEVPMVLDTLFAELDAGRLYLTWRGLAEVRSDDLSDVTSVLVASEALGAQVESPEHYRSKLLAFERDPIGLGEALPASLRGGKPDASGADHAPGAEPDATADAVSALVTAELGAANPMSQEIGNAMRTVLEVVDSAAARSEVPVPDLRARLADAVKQLDVASDAPPVPLLHRPGHMPDPGIRRNVIALERDLRQIEAQVAEATRSAGDHLPADAREKFAEISKMRDGLRDPQWLQLDPEFLPHSPSSTDDPGPGAVLVDRDLSGCDLSGRDLSGADLSHAVLIKTILRGANLRGAKLHRAVLFKSDLDGADLRDADLSSCNAARLRAHAANFSGANLSTGFFENASLRGSVFARCTGEYAWFVGADLTEADFGDAQLENAEFSTCRLDRARLVRADLRSGRFNDTVAQEADFSGATLTCCSFAKALLQRARFVGARGSGSLWSDAQLDDADLRFAWLVSGHFSGVSASRANFTATNLKDARFDRGILEHAVFVQSNLLRANLSKTRISSARFTGANLYEAQLVQASGSNCDFTDANLRRSTLDPPG